MRRASSIGYTSLPMRVDLDRVRLAFRAVLPAGIERATLRVHADTDDVVSVRQNIVQPMTTSRDHGAMITVQAQGGIGYAATADTSERGLRAAIERALAWAIATKNIAVSGVATSDAVHARGAFRSPVKTGWDTMSLAEKVERLSATCAAMKIDPAIVDWSAELWRSKSERMYVTSDGAEGHQIFDRLIPMLRATASRGSDAITRTSGAQALVRQQGLELLGESHFFEDGVRIAEEALELVDAPPCPTDKMDLILAPDQMVLQIHESIGHPIELDRILGDERNYAGTSFVSLDMFGTYRYGSDILNVTFDPTRPEQAASFLFDDDGTSATREHVIKNGILVRGLGGAVSQGRAKMAGVATSRADSWRRPPIDRMSNLNLEAGDASWEAMVGSIECGVFMETNCSWSIDDSRNKFQFGCERARLIEKGKLGKVVKKPNYRGVSETFWRSLTKVGNVETFQVLGTPFCGKGEPNQAIFVGHASPPCLFANADVFGGDA